MQSVLEDRLPGMHAWPLTNEQSAASSRLAVGSTTRHLVSCEDVPKSAASRGAKPTPLLACKHASIPRLLQAYCNWFTQDTQKVHLRGVNVASSHPKAKCSVRFPLRQPRRAAH